MNRYIKTITLENFQSYKNQVITCKPGLNLLIGTSDSGKSAILRAISFVLYNHPKKDTLIHWGEKETSVTLEFSDGVKVTRIKGDGKNDIIAIDSTGKKIPKVKIDKDIPDEIKELLGNPPQDDFNGLISYSDQFSKLFLVDLSPSDLPRSLSHLTGIEVLEESAKQLMSNYKAIEKQTKADEKEYKSLLEEFQSYSYVDDYQTKVYDLDLKFQELLGIESNITQFSKYIDGIDLTLDESVLDNIQSLIDKIDQVLSNFKTANQLAETLKDLQMYNSLNVNHVDEQCLDKLDKIIEKIDEEMSVITNQNKIIKDISTLNQFNKNYELIKQSGQKFSTEYKQIMNNITQSEQDLKEFKEFLIKEKIQCETCGSMLK